MSDHVEVLRAALEDIANRGCERFTVAEGCAWNPALRHDAKYGDDSVCNPCHARAALSAGFRADVRAAEPPAETDPER